jgi:hypothetical protein
MGKFMLKLIGMYIPFVMVILGIGACSFVYKDELFGRFNSSEEVTEEEVIDVQPTEPYVQADATGDVQSTTSDDFIREETPEEVSDDQPELPGIGECVCPDR